jgi:hypothetical protein
VSRQKGKSRLTIAPTVLSAQPVIANKGTAMKPTDWNGHRIPILAHAFSTEHGIGVDVHLRAASEKEAYERLARKLECRQDFLRITGGHYRVKFDHELRREI